MTWLFFPLFWKAAYLFVSERLHGGGQREYIWDKRRKKRGQGKKKKEKQRGHSCFIEICVYVSILPVCAQ